MVDRWRYPRRPKGSHPRPEPEPLTRDEIVQECQKWMGIRDAYEELGLDAGVEWAQEHLRRLAEMLVDD